MSFQSFQQRLVLMSATVWLHGCGVHFHEAETDETKSADETDTRDPGGVTPDWTSPADPAPEDDPCADAPASRDVMYSVQRNSRLDRRQYQTGTALAGRIYIGAYELERSRCTDPAGSRHLYADDVGAIWIEISQLSPFAPDFIRTYPVPEEAVSFLDASAEMGIIVDPSYIVLDTAYLPERDYILRVKVESKSGLVTSARTWHNDSEAFLSLGFVVTTASQPAPDGDEDAHQPDRTN